jgi:hypothetical protein
MRYVPTALAFLAAVAPMSAYADSARDVLIRAAFTTRDKASALTGVNQAVAAADAAIRHDPRDLDARLQRALAISYRGKLSRSRTDVVAARRDIEAIVAADPRNPEAQMALGAWHLAAIIEFGPMLARTVLGARTAVGNQAYARALAMDNGHASIPALASLQRIQVDPSDIAGATRLAEESLRAGANTSFDRLMQKQAATLLTVLRKGNGKIAAATAKLLMPFGRVAN